MNKLEELKALMTEYEKERATYLSRTDNYNYYIRSAKAYSELTSASFELLPKLIAVAEAAEDMMKEADAKIWVQGSGGCSYNPDKISLYALAIKLEPLTKEIK
jgi:hypothetical protein